METIKNYLDVMFARMPDTEQLRALKENLLLNMEEKYHELKREGKSENEAIGIVISEFGNIDELMDELEITKTASPLISQNVVGNTTANMAHNLLGNTTDHPVQKTKPLRRVTEEEAYAFMEEKKKSGAMIAKGVTLCISAVAMLILLRTLVSDGLIGGISEYVGNFVGITAMILLIIPAVGMFIYTSAKMEVYEYLYKPFELPEYVQAEIQARYDAFAQTYVKSVIIGVSLCILAPISVIATSLVEQNLRTYGVVVLLALVAVAVYIFIYFAAIKDSMAMLLQRDGYSLENKEKSEDKVVSAVAAVVWPLAVCIFLVTGLVYHQWHINWIVFPITAILFGMFSGAYYIIKGNPKA